MTETRSEIGIAGCGLIGASWAGLFRAGGWFVHAWDPSPEVLETFILQMSGHGLPVSASMMLGDRDYARQQLRHAYTLDDALLHELAVEMWSFFTGATPAVVQVVALTQ